MIDSTLLIRADANPQIGLGHVTRSLALAEPWLKSGAEVILLTSKPSSATCERAEKIGAFILSLKSAPGSLKDAEEALFMASDWLVLDGYHFGFEYQQKIRAAGQRYLLFDDNHNLDRYFPDFVLNQNPAADPNWYAQRDPKTRLLLGQKFMQFRGEFLTARQSVREHSDRAKKLLVTMGGSDPENITAQVLRHLDGFETTVIVGPENSHEKILHAEFPKCRFVRNPANLPDLMNEADLAITAAGATACELAFLGVPFLAMAIVDNQRENLESLQSLNVGRAITLESLRAEVNSLASDPAARQEMSARQRTLFDGLGSTRAWLRMNQTSLRLRPATAADARLVWNLANDPSVRAVSFNKATIPWEAHIAWFEGKPRDANCRFWIAEKDVVIGVIHFDIKHDEATLSVTVAPESRGKNLGTLLVWSASRKLFAETSVRIIHAFVLPENQASARMFQKAEFAPRENAIMHGQTALHFVLDRANLLE